ncbi:unnamed protein product [Closterium sp. NIES-64]|nr:unnamed protein product [Closterium sp. NIES-64]
MIRYHFVGAESWVVGPPGISLPFLLARLGFEVWLGNSRCGPWSYGHTRWQPKDKVGMRRGGKGVERRGREERFNEYWEWTWADMARHDLPAQIDHILAASHTGARQVFYVGHSQVRPLPLAGASLAPCRCVPCSLQVRPLLLAGASLAPCRCVPCSLQVRPLLLAGASLAPCRCVPCSLQVRPLLLAGASLAPCRCVPCSLQVRPLLLAGASLLLAGASLALAGASLLLPSLAPCRCVPALAGGPLLLAGASLAPCSSTHLPHAAVPPYAVVLPCDWSSVLVCFCAPAHRHFMGTLTFLSALTAGYLPPATIAAAFLFAPVTSLAHLSSPIAHEAAKLDLDRLVRATRLHEFSLRNALGELVVASACASPRINCSSLLSAFTGMHPTTSPPPH